MQASVYHNQHRKARRGSGESLFGGYGALTPAGNGAGRTWGFSLCLTSRKTRPGEIAIFPGHFPIRTAGGRCICTQRRADRDSSPQSRPANFWSAISGSSTLRFDVGHYACQGFRYVPHRHLERLSSSFGCYVPKRSDGAIAVVQEVEP